MVKMIKQSPAKRSPKIRPPLLSPDEKTLKLPHQEKEMVINYFRLPAQEGPRSRTNPEHLLKRVKQNMLNYAWKRISIAMGGAITWSFTLLIPFRSTFSPSTASCHSPLMVILAAVLDAL